ncbi:phytoene desaturase family protein [Spongisporangium articulatum]|uniref:Pyridine nucleotide-disulfide oxidoreductase domain-containing protein 2 n=1 Tax=Spongisporangium articulatum TaxID=3362603 RepID=A0ABW8AN69_9ACTN
MTDVTDVTVDDVRTTNATADAVVIGAGPNGLVAAAMLADAGWDVCVLEAADEVGGAVKSQELQPGYVTDLYSAFYPMAAASPYIRALALEDHGLTWRHAPAVLAHPSGPDADAAAVLYRDPHRTADGLDRDHPGDGRAWLDLLAQWQRIREPFLHLLFSPFPPVRGTVGLLRAVGTRDALRLARTLMLPVARLGTELFGGRHGPLLLTGNAMHADVPVVAPGSGAFGWLMSMLAQDVGFPVPEGGAGRLAAALLRRAESAGAQVVTGCQVEGVEVRGGRAVGVRLAGGGRLRARRAVLADVAAPTLYRSLLPADAVPRRLLEEIDGLFTADLPTVKVNWAVRGRVPWQVPGLAEAGTLHVGADNGQLALWSAALSTGQPSDITFQLMGQLAVADPTRAPEGHETLWAYSHLPRGNPDAGAAERLAERMEETVERHAPGFRDLIGTRLRQLPQDLEADDANLLDGAINGGTAQLFQQLVFRPTPGLGRPETPVAGLYLASAGAHPGGGVHGGPGGIAATAVLHGAALAGSGARALARTTRWLAG